MTKVLVLGGTGMLGSAVLRSLGDSGIEAINASRNEGVRFDAAVQKFESLVQTVRLSEGDFIINCIGLTKGRIDNQSSDHRRLAVRLNVSLPLEIDSVAVSKGLRVIQVATDCVFSGRDGQYKEGDRHDASDVYGKTKSLGEIPSTSFMHLRCSLIGPERNRGSLFFEWLRRLPQGASVTGYINHFWNGLTSDMFASIVSSIIRHGIFHPGIQHLVPSDAMSKDELVRLVLRSLNRTDVTITSAPAEDAIDRTLATDNNRLNLELFRACGFETVPTIESMVLAQINSSV